MSDLRFKVTRSREAFIGWDSEFSSLAIFGANLAPIALKNSFLKDFIEVAGQSSLTRKAILTTFEWVINFVLLDASRTGHW